MQSVFLRARLEKELLMRPGTEGEVFLPRLTKIIMTTGTSRTASTNWRAHLASHRFSGGMPGGFMRGDG